MPIVANGTISVSDFTGLIMQWAGPTAPDNWLFLQGQVISRTTYADLFAILGTTYGAGDGSTTFALPDMRGSTVIGAGEKTKAFTFVDADVTVGTDAIEIDSNQYLYTGQAVVLSTTGTLPAGLSAGTYYIIYVSDTSVKLASSRADADDGTAVDITAAAGGGTHTLTLTLTDRAIGAEGGEESHTLQTEEIPSHSHYVTVHTEPGTGYIGASGFDPAFNANSSSVGGDTPHNNMPPYVSLHFIIKT